MSWTCMSCSSKNTYLQDRGQGSRDWACLDCSNVDFIKQEGFEFSSTPVISTNADVGSLAKKVQSGELALNQLPTELREPVHQKLRE